MILDHRKQTETYEVFCSFCGGLGFDNKGKDCWFCGGRGVRTKEGKQPRTLREKLCPHLWKHPKPGWRFCWFCGLQQIRDSLIWGWDDIWSLRDENLLQAVKWFYKTNRNKTHKNITFGEIFDLWTQKKNTQVK